MRRNSVSTGALGLLLSAALMIGGGCSTIKDGIDLVKGNNEGYEAGLQKALDAGVPVQQLDALLQDAERWAVETAPGMRQLDGMTAKKIFIVGGTLDGSESLSQDEVTAESRRLYTRLQSYGQMTRLFQFIDRSGEYNADMSAYTGDTRQYGDPLGGGQPAGRLEYLPADMFLLKLEFLERRDLNSEPPRIDFTLIPIIEWGGNQGQRVAQETFTRSVVYETNVINNLTGDRGKWIPVD